MPIINKIIPVSIALDEPLLTMGITDELWNEDNDIPCETITIDPKSPKANLDQPTEYVFDEFATDIEYHITQEEGYQYFAGFLGKGNVKLTKKLGRAQTLPSSKLADFENFCCSEWIDKRNKANTGSSYLPF